MVTTLNLKKNDILDLTKREPSLNKLVLAAGWDVAKRGFFSFKGNYDLDLVALLLDENEKVIGKNGLIYYANQRGEGIFLHGDNRTGEGDGDDEKISIALNNVPARCHKIIFAVTIYSGKQRGQSFSEVKNAYVRLLNEDSGNKEICRYNLSEDGGKSTGIIFAELYRVGSDWNFKAVGRLLDASVQSLYEMYK